MSDIETKLDQIGDAVLTLTNDVKHMAANVLGIGNDVKHINDRTIQLEASTKAAHRRIDELKPIVDGHQSLIEQGKGAKAAFGWVWNIVWGLIGTSGTYFLMIIFG